MVSGALPGPRQSVHSDAADWRGRRFGGFKRVTETGSSFIIEGLADYQEARDLAAALMNPLEFPVEILEASHVSAVESEVGRSHLLASGPRRLEVVVGLAFGLAVVVLGVVSLGIVVFTGKRVPNEPASDLWDR